MDRVINENSTTPRTAGAESVNRVHPHSSISSSNVILHDEKDLIQSGDFQSMVLQVDNSSPRCSPFCHMMSVLGRHLFQFKFVNGYYGELTSFFETFKETR
jgi:hypothetical protein